MALPREAGQAAIFNGLDWLPSRLPLRAISMSYGGSG